MEDSGQRIATSLGKGHNQGLKIIYTNARSLVNKIQELKLLSQNSKPDIIAVTKSWTHQAIPNSYLNIPNYYIANRQDRKDTQNGRGGGILIYVNEDIKTVETTCQSAFNQFASIQIPISPINSLSFVVVYRSPNSTIDNNQFMISLLQTVKNPAIVVGDFNFPAANWEALTGCAESQRLIDISLDKFWTQHVDFSTHRNGNKLDLVFAEIGMLNEVRDEGLLGNSDHSVICIETNHPLIHKGRSHERLNHKRGDFKKLRSIFEECDWRQELSSDDMETCWSKFKSIYKDAVYRCIPFSKKKGRKKPPWLSKELLKLIEEKRRAWKNHKLVRSAESWNRVSRLMKNLKKRIQKAKLTFEKKIAKNAKQNPKAFYAYLGGKRSNRTGVGPLQDSNGNIVSDDAAQAQMLNDYYATVFEVENLPAPTQPDYAAEATIEDIEITRSMVMEELKKLKRHSAPGPDGIENVVLIEASDELVKPLVMMFKKSLRTGVVPQDWRSANVTPVFKSGNKKLVSNYRPISLTSTISKILESLVRTSIRTHLLTNDLLSSSQHGFMPRKSCLTNLLHCMEEVTAIIDEGDAVDILYLDFSKAFDKVQHKRLIGKMRHLGIGGKILDWVEAWLSNRMQRVVLNGQQSNMIPVPCSVPQGSVLGPLLFVIFIDDIDLCLEQVLALILKFADDTKVIKRINDQSDNLGLQNVIDNLVSWSTKWQLYFNVGKCKVVHLGRKNPKFQYSMNDTPIESIESERDLGIIIDQSAKPGLQCAKAAQKGNQVLGQLLRSFQCRDKDVLIQLYKVFVRPHLEYAVQAWSPYMSKDIEILEKVQRRMVRQIRGVHGTYEEKLVKIGLTTLQARRERGDCLETFKMLKGFTHVDYSIWLHLMSRMQGAQTRLSSDPLALELRTSRLDLRKHFFSVRVPPMWNSLPLTIRQSQTINQFKNAYDKYKKDTASH